MKKEDILEKSTIVCQAYNAGLARVFNELSEQSDPLMFERDDNAEYIQRETLNAMASWFEEVLPEIGESPAQFFDGLSISEDLLSAYDVFAANCDSLLPEYFQIQLGRQAEGIMPELEKRALALPFDTLDDMLEADAFSIQCVTLELLGQWQNVSIAQTILDAITNSNLMHERFASALKSYFSYAGAESLPALTTAIEAILQASKPNPNLDYLLVYLTELGKEHPDDKIYQLLRQSFKVMEEKIIPVICLGDYGDGRAVPMLRTFVEKNSAGLDRGLLSETLSSIKRLGGEVQDLRWGS